MVIPEIMFLFLYPKTFIEIEKNTFTESYVSEFLYKGAASTKKELLMLFVAITNVSKIFYMYYRKTKNLDLLIFLSFMIMHKIISNHDKRCLINSKMK